MKTPLETIENDEIKQKNLDKISNLGASYVGIILDSKYEIKQEIARGGMGIIYEAYHKYTHQRVAIKVILSGIVAPIQLKRFQKELEAYSLLSHPNVITIHDAGIYKNYPYIVMEYIEGVDICTYVKQQEEQNKQEDSESGEARGRDWKLCARLIYETALGLEYIHSKKMIHRDIKPANILVRSNGNPVIIDLGIVKFNRTQSYNLTRSKETIGTFEYMPIEQAKGKGEKIDERTDVYSLGLVLYELLTGQRAYSGENIMELCYKIMSYYPPLPRKIDPQIPEVLEKITIHATEKQKGKRYASMKEFADELKQYLDDPTIKITSNEVLEIKTLKDFLKIFNFSGVAKIHATTKQKGKRYASMKKIADALKKYLNDTIVKSSSQYTQNQSNEEKNLELATKFYNEQNFTKAFELYEQLAKQGNIDAQFYLGLMYYNGQGVKQDFSYAVYWYEESAIQGHAEAQFNLGVMYDCGLGVKQDYKKARELYEESAKQGNSEAQFILGVM